MFEVTETALEKIREHLTQNNITSAVRVIPQNGCAGPSLALILDEKKDTDQAHESGDVTVLVDSSLLDFCGGIKVDYVEKCASQSGCSCSGGGGFSVTSTNPLPGGGGCSCNSCG